jgi:hypothetical protein
MSSGDKYFLNEEILIKGLGSTSNPLDLGDDDTDLYPDSENPIKRK